MKKWIQAVKKYNFCHLLAVMKQIFIIFVS